MRKHEELLREQREVTGEFVGCNRLLNMHHGDMKVREMKGEFKHATSILSGDCEEEWKVKMIITIIKWN